MHKFGVCAAAFVAGVAWPASAHITLAQKQASPGTSYRLVYRVPHGCGDAATIRLTATIPDGVVLVKPMVKPGWRIDTLRGPYAKSWGSSRGARFTEGVKRVTWSEGRLPDAFYDEFVVTAFLSDDLQPGSTLYFPIIQTCEQGEHRWTEVPSDSQKVRLGEPAPALKLVPRNKDEKEP